MRLGSDSEVDVAGSVAGNKSVVVNRVVIAIIPSVCRT